MFSITDIKMNLEPNNKIYSSDFENYSYILRKLKLKLQTYIAFCKKFEKKNY